MLTIMEIKEVISNVIVKYPIKKLSIFGSYAEETAKEDSDIDILVEFSTTNISLLVLYNIKDEIAKKLHRDIDLIHAPLDKNSLIKINKVIDIYEQ
jgi:predicted nucleotidyltransferase